MPAHVLKNARLNKHDVLPLFEQLEALLRDKISSGALKPGDPLPSESAFVAQFGISRMTVRRSLDRLAADGVIVRKPGKGVYVSQDKLDYNPTTVFSFGTAMRAMGKQVETRMIEQRIRPAPADVARALGLAEHAPVISIRRLRLVDGSPAVTMNSFLPPRLFEGLLNSDLTEQPLSQQMERVSGLVIARSDDTFEATLAREDELAVFGPRGPLPVLLVRGVAYTTTGIPIRATRSVFRGDRFRFQINPDRGWVVHFERPAN